VWKLQSLYFIFDPQEALQETLRADGREVSTWSSEALERVAYAHGQFVAEVALVCFVPSHLYLPLGPASAPALHHYHRRLAAAS
jgi:hypothetical protein